MLKKFEVLKENRAAKLIAVAALTVLIAVGFVVGGVITSRNAITVDASTIQTVTSADGKKVIPAPYDPVNVTDVTIINADGSTTNNVDLAAFDFHVFAENFASNAHTCGNIAVNSLGKTETLGATGAPEFGSRPGHDVDVPKLSYIGTANGWSSAAISDYFVFGEDVNITEKQGQVFIETSNGKWMMGNGKKLMESAYIEKNDHEFLDITTELEKAEGYQRYLVELMDDAKGGTQPDVKVLAAKDVIGWSPWGNTIDVSKYAEDTIIIDLSGYIETFSWFGPMKQDAVTSFITGQINITGTQGKRVIINVDMTDKDNVNFFDTNMKSDNLTNSEDSALTDNNILWNFYERTQDDPDDHASINSYDGTFSVGGTWIGTVLAPEANLKCRAGLNGSMIVKELTTTAETHKSDYTGERSIDDLTDLTVTKHWQDDPAVRPEYITVELKQNNVVYKTIQMTGDAGSTWTYTFKDLPVRDAEGQTYQYEISEKPVPGYKSSQMGFVLYNVSDAKPKEYKLTVEKKDESGNFLPEATLVLTSDSKANLSKVKPTGGPEGTEGNVTGFTATDTAVTWTTTNKGPVVLEHLPGGNYTITEKGAPAGYKLKATSESITVKGDQIVTIVNEKTEVTFKKVNASGQRLPGALLQLTANSGSGLQDVEGTIRFESQSNGSVKWKSGAADQVIKGLPAGSYTLSEVSAPAGYDVAAPIVFNVDDNGNVIINGTQQADGTVSMEDKETPKVVPTDLYKVQISKKDGSSFLADATFRMYHSAGKSLAGVTRPSGAEISSDGKYITWTSSAAAGIIFDNLPAGTYIVEETSAPDGYIKANPTSFTLEGTANKNKGDEAVKNNIDKNVDIDNVRNSATISKLDAFSANAGAQLQNATLTLTHNDDKSLAGVVLSGGATCSQDGKTITWKTGADPIQFIRLPAGSYTLHEIEAPAGYATAADVIFNVDEYGNISCNGSQLNDKTVTMLDEPNKLAIAKEYFDEGSVGTEDDKRGTLAGAKLQLTSTDSKNLSNVVGSIDVECSADGKSITWTSGSEENIFRYLPDGKYTLTELEAPAGYDMADAISFTVSGGKITTTGLQVTDSADGEYEILSMTDKKTVYYSVNISKVDLESHPLAGAQLAIYKVDPTTNTADYNNPVVKFESSDELVSLRLDNGDYILKEISAPEGYYKSEEEIRFNVNHGELIVETDEVIKADPVKQTLTFDADGNASIDITDMVKNFGLPTKVEYSYEADPDAPTGETTQYGDWKVEREAPTPLTKDYQAGSEDIYGTMASVTGGHEIGTPDSITISNITGLFNNAIITIKDDSDQYGNTYAKYRFSYQNIKDGSITVAKSEGSLNAFETGKTYTIYYEIHSPDGDVNFYVVFGDPLNSASVASLNEVTNIPATSTNNSVMTAAETNGWAIEIIETTIEQGENGSNASIDYGIIKGGTASYQVSDGIDVTITGKSGTYNAQIRIVDEADDSSFTDYWANNLTSGTTATVTGNNSFTLEPGHTYEIFALFSYVNANDVVTMNISVGDIESPGSTSGSTSTTTITTAPTSAPTSAPSQPETPANTTLDAALALNGSDIISNNVADKTFTNDGTNQTASADLAYNGYEAGKVPSSVNSAVFNVNQSGLPDNKQVTVTLTFADKPATKVESSGTGEEKVNNLSLANKPIPAANRPEYTVELTKTDATNGGSNWLTSSAAGFELYNAKNNKPVHVTKTGEGVYEWKADPDKQMTAQQQNTIDITDYVNTNGLPHTIGFTFGSVNEDDGLRISATITNSSNGKSVTLPAMDVTATNVYWKNLDLSALDYQNGNNLSLVINQTKDKGDFKAADINLYQTLYTNNAQIKVNKLDEGDYIFIETKLPTDYDYTTDANGMAIKSQRFSLPNIDEDGKLENGGTAAVTQKNIKKTGSITIVKYDDNGNAKGGTEFLLYQVDPNSGTATPYGGESNVYKTGNGGSVVADDLPLGYLYYAVETKAPEGAKLDSSDPMPLNYTDGRAGEYLINYANQEFKHGILLSENIVSETRQNGENANAKVEVLSIGTSGGTAKYSATEGIATFTNTSLKAAFKKTNAAGNPLSGATLRLTLESSDQAVLKAFSEVTANEEINTTVVYNYDQDGEAESIKSVYVTWTSGENPVVFTGIPAGTYTLSEDEAPLGYALTDDVTVEVNEDGTVTGVSETYTYSYENTYKTGKDEDNDGNEDTATETITVTAPVLAMSDDVMTGKLTLTKYEDGFAGFVGGTGFELYAKGENGEYNIPIKAEGSNGSYTYNGNGTVTEFFSDASGNIIVAGLPVELYTDYRFVEKTVPAGFINNPKQVDISFTEEEIKAASAKTAEPDAQAVVEKSGNAENTPIVVNIAKNNDSDKTLSGAALKLTAAGVDLSKVYSTNNNTLAFNEADGSLTWTSGTAPIELRTLPAGTYTLSETEAPDGYAKAADIIFTVNADGTVTDHADKTITMVDRVIAGVAVLTKKDAESASTVLEGAKFELRDKDNNVVTVTKDSDGVYTYDTEGSVTELVTNEDGQITVNALPVREGYKFIETEAPLYYVNLTEEIIVDFENGEVNDAAGTITAEVEAENTKIKGSVTLTKKDAATGDAIGGATFELRENGTAVKVTKTADGVYTYDTAGSETVLATIISGADMGKVTVNGLPINRDYEFVEITAPTGYIKSGAAIPVVLSEYEEGELDSAAETGVVYRNVEAENTKITGNATLTKKEFTLDEEAEDVLLGGATFNLVDAAGNALKFKDEGNGVYSYDPNGSAALVTGSNGANKGKIIVSGLPVSAAADTTYTFVETAAPETHILPTGEDAECDVIFTAAAVSGAATETITATNTPAGGFVIENVKKVSVTVTKEWNDDLDEHEGVVVMLRKTEEVAKGSTYNYYVDEITLSKDNNWTHTFENLPMYEDGVLVDYTVKENGVIGYKSEVEETSDNNFVITNTPTTDMVITKIWEDGGDKEGKRTSVEVEIIQHVAGRDDAVYKTVTISKVENSSEWTSDTISELPSKTEDGKAITYSIREKQTSIPEGYISNANGTTITNTLVTSVTVTKQWLDSSDTTRPAEITVQLMADGVADGEPVKVKASENWTYTWDELVKYDGEDEIVYTAVETAVPENYVSTEDQMTADKDNGFTIVNTLATSVTVEKQWDDGNNIAGKRPTEIKVQLKADGVLQDTKTITADNDGNWIGMWDNLPKYKLAEGGKTEIEYTVEEIELSADYVQVGTPVEVADSENCFVITNKLNVTTAVSVVVTKTWDDNENANGIRPTEIKVQLKANDNNEGEPVTITAGENGVWSYTWEDLAKYAAGAEIVYTVEEVDVPVGYEVNVSGTAIVNKLTESDVTISKVDASNSEEITGARITLELVTPENEGDTLANAKGSIPVEFTAAGEETKESITWTSDAAKGPNDLWGIPLGEYKLTEVLVPDGYEQAEAIEFEITEEDGVRKIYYKDESGAYTVELTDGVVTMEDAPKKAVFSKVDANGGAELPGATLIITALDEDVTLTADKVEAPDYVEFDEENKKTIEWVSKDTPTEIGLLPAGEYTLTEITAPDGYEKAETIKFRVNEDHTVDVFDKATGEYIYDDNVVLMEDAPKKAVFSKVDANGGAELPGATLIITALDEDVTLTADKVEAPDYVEFDEENKKTIEWVSKDTPTEIGLLPAGEYTLTEITAPDGYEKAETIKFRVNEDHTVDVFDKTTGEYIYDDNVVLMEDAPKKAVFSKVDAHAGSEIEGAKLVITAGEGVTLDPTKIDKPSHVTIEDNKISWTSLKTPTEIGLLPEGEYTLTEITAPDGYEVAESIKFKVNANHTVEIFNKETNKFEAVDDNTVVMKDEPQKAVFSKVDAGAGTELAGAKLIIEVVTENVKVDDVEVPKHVTVKDNKISWTSLSTPTEIGLLPAGEYTLTEITAPDGYEKAETIRFQVSENHVVSVYNVETKEFEVVKDNTVVMKDAPSKAKFSKKIAGGSTELAGAKLEIKPSTKGVKIDDVEVPAGVTKDTKNNSIKWTSTSTPIEIGGLPAGDYILVETQAPNGYEIAETIKFRINANHTVSVYDATSKKYVPVDGNTVVMYDKAVTAPIKAKLSFTKRSDKGMTLSGAEFKLHGTGYSKSVTSAESGIVTFVDIPAGTYTLTETTAPIGYTKSASVITVVVAQDGAITFKNASGKTLTLTDVEKALINTEKGSAGTTTTTTRTTTTRTTTTTTRNTISNVQGDGNSNNPNTGDTSGKNIQIAMVGLQISVAAMLACAILYLRRRKSKENA